MVYGSNEGGSNITMQEAALLYPRDPQELRALGEVADTLAETRMRGTSTDLSFAELREQLNGRGNTSNDPFDVHAKATFDEFWHE